MARHSRMPLATRMLRVVGVLVVATAAQATPITVNVTGDIYDYASYRYRSATGTYDYDYRGSTGTLSGTLSWDPALMGVDLSSFPDFSYHSENPGTNVWLTSSLTAVTPDYTETYDPSSSGLPRSVQHLFAYDPAFDGYGYLESSLDHSDPRTGSYAQNYFYFYDYSSPFAPTLGYQSRQYVPIAVSFSPNAGDYGYLVAAHVFYEYDADGHSTVTFSATVATLTSATSVPEPGTLLLLGVGVGALGARRRLALRRHLVRSRSA